MASHATSAIEAALKQYAESIHNKLGLSGAPAAWPEDQLKGPIEVLFGQIGQALGQVVIVRTEVPREADEEDKGGSRVDAAVSVGANVASTLLTGHIELKAPGKGGDPNKLRTKADKDQWVKFKRLPNLIYTDGREWSLQRTGSRSGTLVRFSGDPVVDGQNAITTLDAERFEFLVSAFLAWEPVVPRSSKQIADLLAPLCRLLRTEALEALKNPDSALSGLAKEWRKYLFPNASNEVVADAYAQTFTYALLIARFEGANPLTVESAESALSVSHGLLSEVLGLLDKPAAHAEVQTSTDTILRVIRQIKPAAIVKKDADNPWLYFYEEFLAAYDPKLRKQVGAYYTPAEVVRAQTSFVRTLLIDKFGKPKAFADPDVISLDPAVGTGTYPLGILESVVDNVPSQLRGSVPERLRQAAANLFGIEYLIGPYSVAHLRLSRFLADHGAPVDDQNPLNILLADTLASHEIDPQVMLPDIFGYEQIQQEREEARELKVDTRVVVCIGNPPYLRGKKAEPDSASGGWVTMRRQPIKGAKVRYPGSRRMVADRGEAGIIQDFVQPAIEAGRAGDLKNLYNSYVYFWRWALWKVFEQDTEAMTLNAESALPKNGIVSFITAASFLRGPGFVGMRQHLRTILDEIWIVDLGGDNKGGRRTENVFSIETPVAITTGVRYGEPNPDKPAVVHYVSLADLSAVEKKALLAGFTGLTDPSLNWSTCMEGWQDPFLPITNATYLSWPALTDLLPWQSSGAQMKRSWPIGETKAVLADRWKELTRPLPLNEVTGQGHKNLIALTKRRADLFKSTRDRVVTLTYKDLFSEDRLPAISGLKGDADLPTIRPYAFRSFDRQYVLADARVGDFMRPTLWKIHSDSQRYLTSMLSEVLGEGPAAVATSDVPDLHHFRGSFGGKHVIPLWKDSAASIPNVTGGVIEVLSTALGIAVNPTDIFNYSYGLLSTRSYVTTFWEELTLPGARLPITKDAVLFQQVRDHGAKLLELHTSLLHTLDVSNPPRYGKATYPKAISRDIYPTSFEYDRANHTLAVGDGQFANIDPEVWDYSVSGLRVVDSWLGYRLEKRSGKSGSTLDEIRPSEWPDLSGEQLQRLLWIIEWTIEGDKDGARLLDQVLATQLFVGTDFPLPAAEERSPLSGDDEDDDETLEENETGDGDPEADLV